MTKPSNMRWVAGVIVALAVIGFADAAFLTVEHYRGTVIPCTITSGCQTVTTSAYATIGPVPIALLGAGYYLLILTVGVLILEGQTIWIRRLPWLTLGGFLASLYLVGLQAFVIRAFCVYCLVSAASSTLIFVTSMIGRRGSWPSNGGAHSAHPKARHKADASLNNETHPPTLAHGG